MTDGFKNDLIDVDYVGGEQPTHVKLEGIADQLRVAIQRLGKAVGDIYTQQTNTGSSGQYSLGELGSAGPNLNRMVGSTGWMNPGTFGRTLVSRTVTFAGHKSVGGDPPALSGFSHYNRHQFVLPDPPLVYTSSEGAETVTLTYSWAYGGAYWTIAAPGGGYTDATVTGTGKIVTRVATLSLLNASGEYHVSGSGVITTYDGLDSNEGFSVTYQYHPIPTMYDGASLNVLPDFSQTGTLCTVALVSGNTYSITLPTHTGMRSWGTLSSWTPPDEYWTYDNAAGLTHPNLNQQLLLPVVLRNNLTAGDPIPEGYIQLWDDTNGTVVENVSFTYQSTSVVYCTGATLTVGSAKYRLIVGGTSVGRTLASIASNARWHDHSGRLLLTDGMYMGHQIHHYDCLNLIDEGDGGTDTPGFSISAIGPTRNPHVQYLHRYGFEYANSLSDDTCLHNSMMGDLVLANTDQGLGTSTNSWSIYFGGYPSLGTYGGCMGYDSTDDRLEISGKPMHIGGAYNTTAAEIIRPRLASTSGPRATLNYTCQLEFESQDSGYGYGRIYSAVGSGTGVNDTESVTLTANAALNASGSWERDESGGSARLSLTNTGLELYYISASRNASAWTDAEWDDYSNEGACLFQIGASYSSSPASYHTTVLVEDGKLSFDQASDGSSNPTGSAPTQNSLYSLNIPKAWGVIGVGGANSGAPAVEDEFGVLSAEYVPGAAAELRIVLDTSVEFDDEYYCVVATVNAESSVVALTGTYSVNVSKVAASPEDTFDISVWDIVGVNQVDLDSATEPDLQICFTVFGRRTHV